VEKNPYPDDDYARASEYLRMALALLSRLRIPASPLNYRIGYDYVAGNNEALTTAFDEITRQPAGISKNDLWALNQRLFVQDDKAVETMRLELRRILVNIQGEFQRSGGNLSNYAGTLGRFADILDTSPPPETMVAEVQTVIEDTRDMEAYQHGLNTQMEGVLDEVAALRKEMEQIKEESMTDALTGIANRKSFDVALEQAVQEAREKETQFCLLLADIDHFKQFNDTYGHLVGDKVLRFAAATVKRCVKGKDIAARFGGEEFAVILPQTQLDGAGSLAEQIRTAISSGDLIDKNNDLSYGRIAVSIGIAQFQPSDLPNDLIGRADQALYLAKERGRNRVETALQQSAALAL
jgi:diguanylate cyclase